MEQKTTPRRTQVERTRARKERLIQAATRFFGQNGYHGTSLADIAQAAGVTEPGLLHHYPSKVQLLMDVLAERDRIDRERFGYEIHPSADSMLSSLHALVEYNQTVPGLVQLFTVLVTESIDQNHPGHEFFLQRYQNIRQQSLEPVRQAQEKGEIRADLPPEDLLMLTFAIMDGLQIQWLYEPDRVDMARLFEQFMRLVREPDLTQENKKKDKA